MKKNTFVVSLIFILTTPALSSPASSAPCDHIKLLQRSYALSSSSLRGESDNPFALPSERSLGGFTFRWGSLIDPDQENVDELLDVLNDVQEKYENLGFPKIGELNVYLANSGDGAPEIPFEGGYVQEETIDGRPMMVLHAAMLEHFGATSNYWSDVVVAHELFHVIQMENGLRNLDATMQWTIEGGAEWAATRAYPTYNWLDWNAAAFFMAPEISLFKVNWESDERFSSGRQYYTVAWLYYLSDILGKGNQFMVELLNDSVKYRNHASFAELVGDDYASLFREFSQNHVSLRDFPNSLPVLQSYIEDFGDRYINQQMIVPAGLETSQLHVSSTPLKSYASVRYSISAQDTKPFSILPVVKNGNYGTNSHASFKYYIFRDGWFVEELSSGTNVALAENETLELLVTNTPNSYSSEETFELSLEVSAYTMEDGDSESSSSGCNTTSFSFSMLFMVLLVGVRKVTR